MCYNTRRSSVISGRYLIVRARSETTHRINKKLYAIQSHFYTWSIAIFTHVRTLLLLEMEITCFRD